MFSVKREHATLESQVYVLKGTLFFCLRGEGSAVGGRRLVVLIGWLIFYLLEERFPLESSMPQVKGLSRQILAAGSPRSPAPLSPVSPVSPEVAAELALLRTKADSLEARPPTCETC